MPRQKTPPPVVLLSPSSTLGMSHYTRGLGDGMKHLTEVSVLDAAQEPLTSVWGRFRKLAGKADTRVLLTSHHWSVPFVLPLAKARGGFVFHDPILDAAGLVTRPLHLLYYRLVARHLRLIVLHGSIFAAHLRSLGLASRQTVVVPHGFVPTEFEPSAPYNPAGPLLFIGRLRPYKGLDVLLDALSQLQSSRMIAPVIVGGEGLSQELIPEELEGVEIRSGKIADSEFAALLAMCSAVLLPYTRATQSGLLATAFRAGRPVIATAVGSFPEYVRDGVNGLLIPPGDATALARAISRLLSDPALAVNLAAEARRSWDEELSPVHAASEILRCLR